MSRGRYLLYTVPAYLLVCTFLLRPENESGRKSRVPLAADDVIECIPSGIDAFPGDFLTQEQRRKGGIAVHFIIVSYVCAMTALVCDSYFVPALETIAARLRLSPDVAGATFMAMGASAPELFSSVTGAFVTEDDIGLGTILGSAVFNVLGISGIVGIVLWNKPAPIQWYPVIRDCIVYGTTVLVLAVIIFDNVVRWWEALTLLLIFAAYIILMHFNSGIEAAVRRIVERKRQKDLEKNPLLKEIIEEEPDSVVLEEEEEEGCGSCLCWRVLMFLPSLLFRLTIPPVRWYPATFLMSIVWMGALSYVTVWMVTIIGISIIMDNFSVSGVPKLIQPSLARLRELYFFHGTPVIGSYTFSIPDSVSGLTLLAAGSSVPDLIATVVIAKSGKGNMAMSNLLGSNTFDLAFCLGAPWFVKTLLSGRQGRLLVYSSAMIYTVSTLLLTLVALLVTLHLTRWTLGRTSGLVFLGLYVTSITLACLYELNVFGEINKPTCY